MTGPPPPKRARGRHAASHRQRRLLRAAPRHPGSRSAQASTGPYLSDHRWRPLELLATSSNCPSINMPDNQLAAEDSSPRQLCSWTHPACHGRLQSPRALHPRQRRPLWTFIDGPQGPFDRCPSPSTPPFSRPARGKLGALQFRSHPGRPGPGCDGPSVGNRGPRLPPGYRPPIRVRRAPLFPLWGCRPRCSSLLGPVPPL